MVGGVNFRQIWAWMSDGSGFSGSWERLTGIEATQDEVKEGLFGKGRGKMDPDASSGRSRSEAKGHEFGVRAPDPSPFKQLPGVDNCRSRSMRLTGGF